MSGFWSTFSFQNNIGVILYQRTIGLKILDLKKLIRTATVAMSLDILLKGQLAYLNQKFEVIAVSGQDAHLETVAKREGVKTVAVSMSRSISPIKDMVSLLKLYFLFRREKPYIVHSITPKAGLLSMTAAYFARVPVRIHTFTGLIFPSKTGMLQRVLIAMDKLVCFFATTIYPEGNGVKNDLIHYKITKKPLHIIANGNVNGIDVDYFHPNSVSEIEKETLRKELDFLETDFVFVFVGRLVKDKGINELIEAFEVLSHNNKAVKLLLVGPFESDLDPLKESTVQAIESNGSIVSVGFQNDIRPYLAVSNCLVFPSYREGFPNVVLQAGAMNLPSIVSDINGCNEIIQDAKNGIIIPVKDSVAILNAMQLVYNDANFYHVLKVNSRPQIVALYEQKIVWEALVDEYKKAL